MEQKFNFLLKLLKLLHFGGHQISLGSPFMPNKDKNSIFAGQFME
jgi:hypothetical protein